MPDFTPFADGVLVTAETLNAALAAVDNAAVKSINGGKPDPVTGDVAVAVSADDSVARGLAAAAVSTADAAATAATAAQSAATTAAAAASAAAASAAGAASASALATETAARIAADETLTTAVEAAQGTATAAGTAASAAMAAADPAQITASAAATASALGTEATARATGDTTNADAIAAEATTRAEADTTNAAAAAGALAAAGTAAAAAAAAQTTANGAASAAAAATTAAANEASRAETEEAALATALAGVTLTANAAAKAADLTAEIARAEAAEALAVRTINGISPDDSGDVELPAGGYQMFTGINAMNLPDPTQFTGLTAGSTWGYDPDSGCILLSQEVSYNSAPACVMAKSIAASMASAAGKNADFITCLDWDFGPIMTYNAWALGIVIYGSVGGYSGQPVAQMTLQPNSPYWKINMTVLGQYPNQNIQGVTRLWFKFSIRNTGGITTINPFWSLNGVHWIYCGPISGTPSAAAPATYATSGVVCNTFGFYSNPNLVNYAQGNGYVTAPGSGLIRNNVRILYFQETYW